MTIFPFRRWARTALLGGGGLSLALVLGWLALPWIAPLPPEVLDLSREISTRVTDREGGVLHELLSQEGTRLYWVPLDEMSREVREAFVFKEDRRFFRHPGVDPLALARAAGQDLATLRVVSGGSTITMQLARDLLGSRPRTLSSKAAEALLALRIERQVGKDRILEQYLNRAPFAGGVRGVERAAQAYFHKSASQLSLGEAAFLAVIPRAPGLLDPYGNPDEIRRRARVLLARMEAGGAIGREAGEMARAEPVRVRERRTPFRAPHLVQYLDRREWGHTPSLLATTIDPRLQEEAEAALRVEISDLRDRGVKNGAVVALENSTGKVLAFVGSTGFFDEEVAGQNNGVIALRQPGSALKPFTYALGLSRGMTLAELVPDVEAHFSAGDGVYSPKNFSGRYYGPVRVREALANSLNVSAVKVAQRVGVRDLLPFLREAGFSSLDRDFDHYGLGLTLGNGEVSLLELTTAFAAFARGGKTVSPVLVTEVRDELGRRFPQAPSPLGRNIFSPQVAYLVGDVLSDENARMMSFGVLTPLNFPYRVAVKTGTSRNFTDNWCVGFTREVTVGVWVGNFDSTPMKGVSGITGAGPVFHRVMTAAMEGSDAGWFPEPEGIGRTAVCTLSGKLPTDACRGTIEELFLAAVPPRERCDYHRLVPVDRRNGLRADGSIPPELVRQDRYAVFPAQYLEWARAEGVPAPPSAFSPYCLDAPRPAARRLALLYPKPEERFILDDLIPRRYQTVLPRLDADEPLAEVDWFLDGELLGKAPVQEPLRLPLSPGRHDVEVADPRTGARSAKVSFEVLRPDELGYFW